MHVILKYFPITSVELRPLYQRITLTVWMEQKGWSKWVTRPLSAVQRLPILNLPYKVIRGLSLNIQLYYHHRSSRYMKHGAILKQIWVSITDTVSWRKAISVLNNTLLCRNSYDVDPLFHRNYSRRLTRDIGRLKCYWKCFCSFTFSILISLSYLYWSIR